MQTRTARRINASASQSHLDLFCAASPPQRRDACKREMGSRDKPRAIWPTHIHTHTQLAENVACRRACLRACDLRRLDARAPSTSRNDNARRTERDDPRSPNLDGLVRGQPRELLLLCVRDECSTCLWHTRDNQHDFNK